MTVDLTKSQISLLDQFGVIVTLPDRTTYKFLPFWFKETGVGNVHEMFKLGALPDELTELIISLREGDLP